MVGVLFWLFVGAIFYTYLGYPALLALLARLRAPAHSYLPPPSEPRITLLIAAHNEEAVIGRKLQNSLALDYPRDRLQILVAADGSEDRTADIVRSYADVGVEMSYSPERCGKMAAINRAMPLARGEIVVFSDANNMYTADTLRSLVAPFVDPAVGASSGVKIVEHTVGGLSQSEGFYWKYESFIKRQESRLGSCTGAPGEVFAIRRELFEPPPANVINDDFVMAMRIVRRGYRVVYVPEAHSSEAVSLSATDEIARRSRIIAGRYQAIAMAAHLLPFNRPLVVWQVVSHKFLRPLVPLAMAGALVANLVAVIWPAPGDSGSPLLSQGGCPLVWLAPPFNWLLLGLQLTFYGLAGLGRCVPHRTLVGKLLYVPTFLLDSNFAALVGLIRFLTRRQSVLWKRARRGTESA